METVVQGCRLLGMKPQPPSIDSFDRPNAKALEGILHFLLDRWDPIEASKRFSGSWPILDRSDSRQFRTACLGWLEELKRAGHLLPPNLPIRRSFLDEAGGPRVIALLESLVNAVIRRVLERDYHDTDRGHMSIEEEKKVFEELSTRIRNIEQIEADASLRLLKAYPIDECNEEFLSLDLIKDQLERFQYLRGRIANFIEKTQELKKLGSKESGKVLNLGKSIDSLLNSKQRIADVGKVQTETLSKLAAIRESLQTLQEQQARFSQATEAILRNADANNVNSLLLETADEPEEESVNEIIEHLCALETETLN